jgi:hypothetical protein
LKVVSYAAQRGEGGMAAAQVNNKHCAALDQKREEERDRQGQCAGRAGQSRPEPEPVQSSPRTRVRGMEVLRCGEMSTGHRPSSTANKLDPQPETCKAP